MSPPPVVPAARGDLDPERLDADTWRHRMRLERELHDGPALRLSAATLRLGLLRHHVDDPALRASLLAVQDDLHAVLQELRDVAGALYPPLLRHAGLGPAVGQLAEDLAVPVALDVGPERYDPAAEGAAYYTLAEGLRATSSGGLAVTVAPAGPGPSNLACTVTGLDDHAARRLRARARALGAEVPDGGTVDAVVAVFPCG